MTTRQHVLAMLGDLRPDSNKRLPTSVLAGVLRVTGSRRSYMLISATGRGTELGVEGGYENLVDPGCRQHHRRWTTFAIASGQNDAAVINNALLGGTSYPVLTSALGLVAGVAAGPAGLLFTVATTALSAVQPTPRVLVRPGDELWIVENIGKVGGRPVHVAGFFLYDPFRASGRSRHGTGWLIHEERTNLTF